MTDDVSGSPLSQPAQVNSVKFSNGWIFKAVDSNNIGLYDNTGTLQFEWNAVGMPIFAVSKTDPSVFGSPGVELLLGTDCRSQVSSVDSVPIVIYSKLLTGYFLGIRATIFCRVAGTLATGTYKIVYTQGGNTVTRTLTVSALGSSFNLSENCVPDDSTNITGQLTDIGSATTQIDIHVAVTMIRGANV